MRHARVLGRICLDLLGFGSPETRQSVWMNVDKNVKADATADLWRVLARFSVAVGE